MGANRFGPRGSGSARRAGRTALKRKLVGILLLCGFGAAGSCSFDDREVQLAFPLLGDAGVVPGLGPSAAMVPQLEVTPATIDLGWVTTGFSARASIRIANSGGAPLDVPTVALAAGSDADFAIIQNQCLAALAPGERCEIRVQVVPSRAAELRAVVHVEGSGGLAADVVLNAEGLAAGDLILAPSPGSFADLGSVSLGATVQGAFTLVNPGSTASGPIQVRSNRPEFVVLPPTGAAGECVMGTTSLINGESCSLRVAFTPTERGPLEATLTSRSDAAGSVSATLSGRGLAPGRLIASAAEIDFGGVVLGQGAERNVRLSNAGDEPLTLIGASLAPLGVEGFAISNSDCGAGRSLAADEGCEVQLEFRPPRAGEEMTAELQAEVAEGSQRQVIALRGIGLEEGALAVAPLTAGEDDFGDVQVGSSLVRVFQIANPLPQPSGVLTLSTSEGFTIEAPPGPGECSESTSIVDGASCTVRVRFSPTQRLAYQGALTVTSPLAGAKGLPLSGRGIVPPALEASQEINFGRVFTNASATRTLSVRNAGDEPMAPPSLEVMSATPELAAAFSYENGCLAPLGFDETCDIQVRLSPTRAVPHSANLHLVSTPGGATTVLLLAEALAPGSLLLAPAAGTTADFGDVPIGAPATRNFTLTNPGNVASGPVTIASDNSRFEVLPGDCNPADSPGLVDGSSCSFGVRFTPDTSLEVIASLSALSPGAGQTGLEIRGRGRLAANLVASAGNRDLGRANIGQQTLTQPANQFTWTVTNTGDLASGVLSVANDNPTEFLVSNDTCNQQSVPGGGTCTMVIRFIPSTTGSRGGRVEVLETGSDRSATVALTGFGVRLAQLGQSCVNATCAAGTCTRGVCCDRACDGACQVCSSAGVCSDQSGQEPCGNGNGRCFGVNRCLLPNALACGQGTDCGSGNCERRLNGQGANDRICCQQDCDATGQQCNAQGQCQTPALGDGALCGRNGDPPCAQGLECKACPGGGNRCTPANACCGGCQAPYVCVDGDDCDCPLQQDGLRQIDCGGGLCIQRRDGACCPATPDCPAARPNCDPADNLCKQCVNATQCAGSNRACTGGVCTCAANTRDCGGGRCIPNNQCCENCTGGRVCDGGTCRCPDGQTFSEGRCVLPQGATCTPNGTPCVTGQCVDGVCCENLCQGVCTQCQAGTGRCVAPADDGACQINCNTGDDCRVGTAITSNRCLAAGQCKTQQSGGCTFSNPSRNTCSAVQEFPGCAGGGLDCLVASVCNGMGACVPPTVSCNGQVDVIEENNCCSLDFPDSIDPVGFVPFCEPAASGNLTVLCDNTNDCPTGTVCCLNDNGNFNIIGCQTSCGVLNPGSEFQVCGSPGGGGGTCPAGRSCTVSHPSLPNTWRFCTAP
jgi:hypothetical protein